MKTTRNCNMLAAALATALLSPPAWAQSDDVAGNAAAQAQQVPRPPSPPPVTPRLPVNAAEPVTTATDQQRIEEPMTSNPPPHSQASERAADQSAVAQHEVWMELDTDRDGRISATEAGADAAFNTRFAMMDSDGDGFLTADEYRAQQPMVHGDDMPPARSQGAGKAAEHSSIVHREAWSRLDTDGDGRISSVEASMDPTFSAHLSAMDADDDGFVTDAEYRAFARTASASGDDAYTTSGDANIDQEAGMDEAAMDEQERMREAGEKADDDRDE